ncbi:substrate-binding periplasmic protein [Desulfonema magnum]|uniref:ABC transporter, solute-binding protein family 3 n=1 Tax=Desulfonema magnum TaxID=45655 RepID=A0A975GTD4_9BACT|nr:transporter substrate-binding domain-containing protein [Desulfonema magnum]QTA92862.1 putative ABC transporter, solute-binding protein family 3 [Desulfonema magnum]
MLIFIRIIILLPAILCMIIGVTASAKDLKASIAQMPIHAESKDKGVLVDLVKAIAEVSGHKTDIRVVPFKRSVYYVTSGKADFHLPLIKNPALREETLDYDYSTETIFHVNFVLYSNKNKAINKAHLKNYYIETDLAHVRYFDFPVHPSSKIKNSLIKADMGRTDGFIFADTACDPLIKKYNFKNIRRKLYKRFEVKIVLPKGGRGGETDKILTSAINKLRKSGRYQKIMGTIDLPYDDWQP